MLFCVLLTFWLSVLVRAFAWAMILRPEGPINAALLGLGLVNQPLALVRNETGVVIGMVHYMLPYAVLPLYANMQGIDRASWRRRGDWARRPSPPSGACSCR